MVKKDISCETCSNEKGCDRLAFDKFLGGNEKIYKDIVRMYGCHAWKERDGEES